MGCIKSTLEELDFGAKTKMIPSFRTKDVRIATNGSEKYRFTVTFCVTADGTKLITYLIFLSNIIISKN